MKMLPPEPRNKYLAVRSVSRTPGNPITRQVNRRDPVGQQTERATTQAHWWPVLRNARHATGYRSECWRGQCPTCALSGCASPKVEVRRVKALSTSPASLSAPHAPSAPFALRPSPFALRPSPFEQWSAGSRAPLRAIMARVRGALAIVARETGPARHKPTGAESTPHETRGTGFAAGDTGGDTRGHFPWHSASLSSLCPSVKCPLFLVPRDRIELPTRGFSIPCSTN